MNIVVVGSGYVGLVTGCCLAEAGNRVVCVDHDERKVASLKGGRLPFHEPGLQDILRAQLDAGRLTFETRIAHAMQNVDIVFLAVGTPPLADGNANLENLFRVVQELADTAFDDCVVVIKSTVPVGTGDRIEQLLNDAQNRRPGEPRLHVVSNPEFLAEGRAVQDFRHPDRIVVGTDDAEAAAVLAKLYEPFITGDDCLMLMDRRSAELAKYACNAMLAARISVVNELAGIAGTLGADISEICRVLKGDPRIGGHYLNPGVGYGGSCLPKDLNALVHAAETAGEPAELLRSVQTVNMRQRERLLEAIVNHFHGRVEGRRIAMWGLSFKPGTDDVRAAPSLTLAARLVELGAVVQAYDPVAADSARHALAEAGITQWHCEQSALAACHGAEALVVMTEWDEFRVADFEQLAAYMPGRLVFDARGLYDSAKLQQHGFAHFHLGMRSGPALADPAPTRTTRRGERDARSNGRP